VEISNKGVQILLNRMESHPEEFIRAPMILRPTMPRGLMRWDWVLEPILRRVANNHANTHDQRIDLPFLTDNEVNALYDKYLRIQGDAFTNRVMGELLIDERFDRTK
jgi:hypothetical protein